MPVESADLTSPADPLADTRAGRLRTRVAVRLLPSDRLGGWTTAIGLAVFALVLRLVALGTPSSVVFDEVYYAKDANDLLLYGVAKDAAGTGPGFVVHPPIGKYMIAAGIKIFGNDAYGWRWAAAVTGALSVLVLVRVARRMTGSTLLGGFAGLLLALDGLHYVQSRVAMLDIFLMFWLLAAFACLVVDRDAARARLARHHEGTTSVAPARLGLRPWRLAAGLCFGLAVATKWNALFFLAAFGLLIVWWDSTGRRSAGERRPMRTALLRDAPAAFASTVLVALLVYVASWWGWFASSDGWDRHWADGRPTAWPFVPDALRSLWHYHAEIYHFASTLTASHTYASDPAGWLLLARPVLYYYEQQQPGTDGCPYPSGCVEAIHAIGNPMIWWAAGPAVLVALWLWVTRHDWRGQAIVIGVAAGWLPWFAYGDRTMFSFYALPFLPFLVLALTLTAGLALGPPGATAARRGVGAVAVGAYALLVVAVFFWLQPVLAGTEVPYADWLHRMLMRGWY